MKLFYYNQRNYSKVAYNKPNGEKKTISSSGCGVVSAVIAINTLAQKNLYTVKKMRDLAVSSGARIMDGTNEAVLLNAICKKYPEFSYKTSNNVNELVTHLKNGGVAVCNQGDAYNVFSTSGHFVCAWRMLGGNIDVADPSMYTGKYETSPRKNRIVAKTDEGCVVTSTEMAKATADRFPAYYLISYKPKKKTYFTPNATATTDCKVYADNQLTEATGALVKGEKLCVRFKGKVLAFVQYNTVNGYKVGLVKLNNLRY